MNRNEFITVTRHTVKEFATDDVALLAAGLTYYFFFSVFPLLLLAMLVLSMVVDPASAREFIFENVAKFAPSAAPLFEGALNAAIANRQSSGLIALVGLGTLAFSASSAFATLDKALNRAWGTEHRPSFFAERLASFIMMAGMALLVFLSLLASSALTFVRSVTERYLGILPADQIVWQMANAAISVALMLVTTIFLYRFVPRTEVLLRDVWLGALGASLAWVVVKEAFALYLGSSFANYDAVYGTMGAVIALLTWIYLSSLIILAGAEFASEVNRFRRLQKVAEQAELAERAQGQPRSSPWFGERPR